MQEGALDQVITLLDSCRPDDDALKAASFLETKTSSPDDLGAMRNSAQLVPALVQRLEIMCAATKPHEELQLKLIAVLSSLAATHRSTCWAIVQAAGGEEELQRLCSSISNSSEQVQQEAKQLVEHVLAALWEEPQQAEPKQQPAGQQQQCQVQQQQQQQLTKQQGQAEECSQELPAAAVSSALHQQQMQQQQPSSKKIIEIVQQNDHRGLDRCTCCMSCTLM